jgi:hypothetical protein
MIRLGKAWIKVNGELLESMPAAKLDVGGYDRDPVIGATVVLGFSEKVHPASVECEISVGKDTRVLDMNKWVSESITFECDTGQVFVIRDAFVQSPPVLTAEDGGKVPLKFFGPPAEQVN